MGGKVLVPAQEHCDRLVAARLQADILGTSTLIVARTDAEAATFLTSNIDVRDHPFILGATQKSDGGLSLNEALAKVRARTPVHAPCGRATRARASHSPCAHAPPPPLCSPRRAPRARPRPTSTRSRTSGCSARRYVHGTLEQA